MPCPGQTLSSHPSGRAAGRKENTSSLYLQERACTFISSLTSQHGMEETLHCMRETATTALLSPRCPWLGGQRHHAPHARTSFHLPSPTHFLNIPDSCVCAAALFTPISMDRLHPSYPFCHSVFLEFPMLMHAACWEHAHRAEKDRLTLEAQSQWEQTAGRNRTWSRRHYLCLSLTSYACMTFLLEGEQDWNIHLQEDILACWCRARASHSSLLPSITCLLFLSCLLSLPSLFSAAFFPLLHFFLLYHLPPPQHLSAPVSSLLRFSCLHTSFSAVEQKHTGREGQDTHPLGWREWGRLPPTSHLHTASCCVVMCDGEHAV